MVVGGTEAAGVSLEWFTAALRVPLEFPLFSLLGFIEASAVRQDGGPVADVDGMSGTTRTESIDERAEVGGGAEVSVSATTGGTGRRFS